MFFKPRSCYDPFCAFFCSHSHSLSLSCFVCFELSKYYPKRFHNNLSLVGSLTGKPVYHSSFLPLKSFRHLKGLFLSHTHTHTHTHKKKKKKKHDGVDSSVGAIFHFFFFFTIPSATPSFLHDDDRYRYNDDYHHIFILSSSTFPQATAIHYLRCNNVPF